MLLKVLISFIKRYLNKNSMSYEFKNTKVKTIEDKIKLREKATTDGKNNLPRSESETFSNCENEAIVSTDEIRNEEIENSVTYLNTIKNKIIDSTAKLGQQNFYIDNFNNRIQQTLTAAEGRLSNLKSSFITHNNEVRNFKLENKLDREPKSLTPINIIIGMAVIAILFIIELQVNGNLLAPAMGSGQKEGLAVAAGVAGLNVFVSFAFGFFVLKNFHHVSSSRKIISKISILFYAIFISYLNWALGAYRSIHEKTGANIKDLIMGTAETSLETGNALFPWTVDLSFTSFTLVFIGIGFAIASLLDGYFFGDRYPGFGEVGKGKNEDKKEINRIREHLATEVNLVFKNEIKKTGEKRDSIISGTLRKNWVPNITSLENTFEGYRRFASKLNEDLDHIIGEYRSVNGMFRTMTEPKYWKDSSGKVKTRYYDMRPEKLNPENVYRDFVVLYLNKEQIEKKIEGYQNKIQKEADDYIIQINSLNEDVNKKIESLREKYSVE
jgi:hypothetical protein